MRFDRIGVVVGAMLCGALLAGCNRAEDSASNPWAAEFAAAYASTQSDFVRRVLEDGVIDSVEIRESQERHLGCLTDAGIPAVLVDDAERPGGRFIAYSGDAWRAPENQPIIDHCFNEWEGSIPELYWGTTNNPYNENIDDMVAACLVRNGIVPEGFTGRDYHELFVAAGTDIELVESADGTLTLPEYIPHVPIILPGGANIEEGVAWQCHLNPRHDL